MTEATKELTLRLTDIEAEVLADMVDEVLRAIQGDGSLPDEQDDALVTLNDKIENALRGLV